MSPPPGLAKSTARIRLAASKERRDTSVGPTGLVCFLLLSGLHSTSHTYLCLIASKNLPTRRRFYLPHLHLSKRRPRPPRRHQGQARRKLWKRLRPPRSTPRPSRPRFRRLPPSKAIALSCSSRLRVLTLPRPRACRRAVLLPRPPHKQPLLDQSSQIA